MPLLQVFCGQPCDVIGQDFELPMQITASPVQAPPSVRSLEAALQEAIQKAPECVCVSLCASVYVCVCV